jgi:Fe-S-cluster-containing dehydrogenase component
MLACPYGAPRFDPEGKISKCDGCSIRVENGLIPACVRVCTTKALKYDTTQNIEQLRKEKLLRKLANL